MAGIIADRPYTDEDIAFIREKWLIGWTDRRIGQAINHPEQSIQSKRYKLKLTLGHHPERPKIGANGHSGRRTYTKTEEQDILRRLNSKEEINSIAARYEVTVRAMRTKANRLLDRPPERELSSRGCLSCGAWFLSREPRSRNRRCFACQEAMNTNGANFLTLWK